VVSKLGMFRKSEIKYTFRSSHVAIFYLGLIFLCDLPKCGKRHSPLFIFGPVCLMTLSVSETNNHKQGRPDLLNIGNAYGNFQKFGSGKWSWKGWYGC
jgi:hypothetical protein